MPAMTHPTKNDLDERTRRAVVALLNRQLADTIDLSLQAKQAHWNVKGPNFIGLHELFDKVYDHVEDDTDDIAERAAELGGTAVGTIQSVVSSTRLTTYPLDIASGRDHVDALSSAVASLAASTRAAIEEATRAGDLDTADLFTDISRGLDKLLWLIEAHLQAEE